MAEKTRPQNPSDLPVRTGPDRVVHAVFTVANKTPTRTEASPGPTDPLEELQEQTRSPRPVPVGCDRSPRRSRRHGSISEGVGSRAATTTDERRERTVTGKKRLRGHAGCEGALGSGPVRVSLYRNYRPTL